MDVICAGDARGSAAVARALAREGLRVGLATVLPDDSYGRAVKAKLEQVGVDTAGVVLAADRPLIATSFDDEPEGELPWSSVSDRSAQIEVPAAWQAGVLLLSGVSPFVARAAAFCKAARAARSNGTLVVLDLDVRWEAWRGRDAKTLLSLLREVDVAWGSAEDLFGLNLDSRTFAELLRPGAVFCGTDGAGSARARGAFGEIVRAPKDDVAIPPAGEGDSFIVAICMELARLPQTTLSEELWTRALERGYVGATTGSGSDLNRLAARM